VYGRTVRCIGDVLGRFTNHTRGTKHWELVLAGRWNERVLHFDDSETWEGIISGKFGKERLGKACK